MKDRTVMRLSLAGLVLGSTTSQAGTLPAIPESLRPPATEMLALELAAKGVQIYECKARADEPTRFEWTFKAPEADLFDRPGRRIGKHYAGPTWESDDGSKVTAAVKARDNAPDSSAIPWLLLEAKSTTGSGVFSRTTSIQRAHTAGGNSPAETCGEAQAGQVSRIPYSATYYFYVSKP
ncbi:DUF3455 domain-containing protein [Aromatoleum buckelii]|uniref:DUF3455 domain-containing protein n=1 Tax=Aromatoleum buckelii TaxID=200254 RepID=A0ABX1N7E9_9RHOO|nr:DUF3455 domain-containing protein [Aromatoleum buckelii]